MTATDLPEPVVPATSICGALAKSVSTGLPEISLPIAILIKLLGSRYVGVSNNSIKRTISRLLFGTSMPIYGFPGITSTTRTEAIDIERAKSREILVTLDALTPGARSSSKRVTTGPGWASTTCALTLNSCSLISRSSDNRANCSAVKLTFLFGSTSSSSSRPGKVGKSRRFCATCMARDIGRPNESVNGASRSKSSSISRSASGSALPAVSCQASIKASLESVSFGAATSIGAFTKAED